jgi:hypothetical protein
MNRDESTGLDESSECYARAPGSEISRRWRRRLHYVSLHLPFAHSRAPHPGRHVQLELEVRSRSLASRKLFSRQGPGTLNSKANQGGGFPANPPSLQKSASSSPPSGPSKPTMNAKQACRIRATTSSLLEGSFRQPHDHPFVCFILRIESQVLETNRVVVRIAMAQGTSCDYQQPFNGPNFTAANTNLLVKEHGFTLLSPGASSEAE